ncbi:zinc ribbon domain-containing protein [Breznakiella homolactica]|uniref:Nucleic acid-binding protein n=1 Tax=Breznakiella homolactica TaxID=2798577 RepID=A0A7T7XKR3_9SPIR|nr:C4-type zinc ribbon domain-containing protein [Breznakiella homolactica]QQO08156.1 nucleic acid-binding protein [Breznakiella homolactica]
MVMEEVFEKLRTLQDILSQKISLEQEIEEIPKLLTTQEELLARLKKAFIEKNQEYEKARTSEAEYRNLLAEAEGAREKAEKNMDSINTQREYEALDKEIRDASEREQQYRKDLQREERILSELDEQMKQNAALIEQQEKELEDRRSGIQAEISEKGSQVKTLQKDEDKLVPGLDPEVLFKFERIIRNKMGRGIVAIKGGVCMGCHMILPAQFANTVREGEDIVFCPYCSRILFYEESEGDDQEYFSDDDAGSLADLDDMDDDEYDEDDEDDEKVSMDYEE